MSNNIVHFFKHFNVGLNGKYLNSYIRFCIQYTGYTVLVESIKKIRPHTYMQLEKEKPHRSLKKSDEPVGGLGP